MEPHLKCSRMGDTYYKHDPGCERPADEFVDAGTEIDRLRAALDAERARAEKAESALAKRDARCERTCMGYPAKDVRHWVGVERLESVESALSAERALRRRQIALIRAAAEKIDPRGDNVSAHAIQAVLDLLVAVDEASGI